METGTGFAIYPHPHERFLRLGAWRNRFTAPTATFPIMNHEALTGGTGTGNLNLAYKVCVCARMSDATWVLIRKEGRMDEVTLG